MQWSFLVVKSLQLFRMRAIFWWETVSWPFWTELYQSISKVRETFLKATSLMVTGMWIMFKFMKLADIFIIYTFIACVYFTLSLISLPCFLSCRQWNLELAAHSQHVQRSNVLSLGLSPEPKTAKSWSHRTLGHFAWCFYSFSCIPWALSFLVCLEWQVGTLPSW